MPGADRSDVLLALLGTSDRSTVDGHELSAQLAAAGRPVRADRLLRLLLDLERAGHADIRRDGDYGFSITEAGRSAAYAVGAGRPVELVVVMVDLVDFVAFTDRHGDDAGLQAATSLGVLAKEELEQRGGRIVKHLGDGILGSLPPDTDPVAALSAIGARCRPPAGDGWAIRAAARRGRPIALAGDLYGTDVNLAARLCAAAAPGQAVLSGVPALACTEVLEVRGVESPVPVARRSIQ